MPYIRNFNINKRSNLVFKVSGIFHFNINTERQKERLSSGIVLFVCDEVLRPRHYMLGHFRDGW